VCAAQAAAQEAPPQEVQVHHDHGTYTVSARFAVAQTPAVVRAVLSDYEQISRFMPDIRSSIIVQRTPRLLVEQEAVSRYALFSRTVHMTLEVTEDVDGIHFVDRSGRSFTTFQGQWLLVPHADGTTITYELSVNPAFSVPQFVLRRMLTRDSRLMIAQLKQEMASRPSAEARLPNAA